MDKVLSDIQDGTYARGWIAENRNGRPRFDPRRKRERSHPIEEVGRELRRMMPFLDAKEV